MHVRFVRGFVTIDSQSQPDSQRLHHGLGYTALHLWLYNYCLGCVGRNFVLFARGQ